jgi:hypothetical protein
MPTFQHTHCIHPSTTTPYVVCTSNLDRDCIDASDNQDDLPVPIFLSSTVCMILVDYRGLYLCQWQPRWPCMMLLLRSPISCKLHQLHVLDYISSWVETNSSMPVRIHGFVVFFVLMDVLTLMHISHYIALHRISTTIFISYDCWFDLWEMN